MRFLNWIKNLFKSGSCQDNIEAYISSKQPKTAAEIDFWIKQYHHQYIGRNFL